MWLSALGGLGGVLLAFWSASALEALVSGAFPVALDLRPDWRVVAGAGAASAVTAVLFGLLPALGAARVDVLRVLKATGGGAAPVTRTLTGRALVVAQIAASLVLLVAAGLFVRSLTNLRHVDTGFDPAHVLVVSLSPPAGPIDPTAKRRLYADLLEHGQAVPGVESVSASVIGVFSRDAWRNVIAVDGFVPADGGVARTFVNGVTTDYFETMRLAILRGRAFTAGDDGTAPAVALVNETFARQFFAGGDPTGRQVALCSSEPCGPARTATTIVGLVEDGKYGDLRESPRAMLYVAAAQADRNLQELQVRATGDAAGLAATLHRALSAVDARVAVVGMAQARDLVDRSIVAERMVATLSATFGLLALSLTLVGLYGLVAYLAAQRTAELGIRMALGASRGEVRRLVLRDTTRLLALGLGLGIPVALAAAHLLAGLLYGVAPGEPFALVLGVVTLSTTALVAGWLPARRAARVDPAVVLRAE
jgi:predicted permease